MPTEKTSTWKAGNAGSFWVAADWTNGIPDASTDALITAPGVYTVTSAETGVIDALSLAAGITLAITNDSALTITNGTDGLSSYTDSGWINVGLGSSLGIGNELTLSGGRIYSVGDTTIDNAKLNLSNLAVITSYGGTVTLAHDNIVMDANSQLRGGVANGVTPEADWILDITDSYIRGGQVLAREGNVYLTDDTLNGVYMDGGPIYVEGQSNLFDGTTTPMLNTGEVTVEDGAALTLSGTIHNISTDLDADYVFEAYDDALSSDAMPGILLSSSSTSSANTELLIKGTVTLSGKAIPPLGPAPFYNNAILLSDSPNNIIDGAGVGHGLLNNVNNVIEGSGHIGVGDGSLAVTNDFWIDADGSNYGLYINTSSPYAVGVLVNNGVIEASLDGDLHLVNTNVDGGTAYIADSGSMELQGSSHLSVDFAGSIQYYGAPAAEYTESLTLDNPFDHSFTTGGSTISFDTNDFVSAFDDDCVNLVGLNYLSGSTHATYSWSGGSTGTLEITNGYETVDLTIANGGGINSGEFSVSKYTVGGQTGTTVKFVA